MLESGTLAHGMPMVNPYHWPRQRSRYCRSPPCGAPLIEEPAPLRVRNGFQTVMRAELAVDVMQMIPQRLC